MKNNFHFIFRNKTKFSFTLNQKENLLPESGGALWVISSRNFYKSVVWNVNTESEKYCLLNEIVIYELCLLAELFLGFFFFVALLCWINLWMYVYFHYILFYGYFTWIIRFLLFFFKKNPLQNYLKVKEFGLQANESNLTFLK